MGISPMGQCSVSGRQGWQALACPWASRPDEEVAPRNDQRERPGVSTSVRRKQSNNGGWQQTRHDGGDWVDGNLPDDGDGRIQGRRFQIR